MENESVEKKKNKPDFRRIVFSIGTGVLFALFLLNGFALKHYGNLLLEDAKGYLIFVPLTAVLSVGFYFFYGHFGFSYEEKPFSVKVMRFFLPGCFVFIFAPGVSQT